MCCFSLIFNEIQIWGNKKRFECKHNRNLKKISNSDKIHICTWRGQDLLQFRLKDSKPSQAIQAKVEQSIMFEIVATVFVISQNISSEFPLFEFLGSERQYFHNGSFTFNSAGYK